MTIYWAGVLFAAGMGVIIGMSIDDEHPVGSIFLAALLLVVALGAWFVVGAYVAAMYLALYNKLKG